MSYRYTDSNYQSEYFLALESIGKFYQEICAQVGLIKIKNKRCLNGEILFFVALLTEVCNRIFSTSFGHFAVEKIPKLNDCSTLSTPNYFASESSVNLSLMLKITHAEPFPKKI